MSQSAPATSRERDAGAPVLMWFTDDLRLSDHPALAAAARTGSPVIPVFVHDPQASARQGRASDWWLHHSLTSLHTAMKILGSRLVIRVGNTETEMAAVARTSGASAVYASRSWLPARAHAQERVARTLNATGVSLHLHSGQVLFTPGSVLTGKGEIYRVFTPFWKACLRAPEPVQPLPAPDFLPAPLRWPRTTSLESLNLLPRSPDWAQGLRHTWEPGEHGAADRLASFMMGPVADYSEARDVPGTHGTSMLSPHLHFGEVSPRQVWYAAARAREAASDEGVAVYLKEIGWREFCYQLLYTAPELAREPLREEFAAFPWRQDAAQLNAWQTGCTGVPIVDAGMRQLWHTGWMHNRVRMIVASFLVKNLLLPWQQGEAWFWDTLVDADLASNAAGWQWVAGCGADAAPYFRIFNPVRQGERFDPQGKYVRRWVPALAEVPDKFVHAPWAWQEKSSPSLGMLGKKLDYPTPIVDLRESRDRALQAYQTMRDFSGG